MHVCEHAYQCVCMYIYTKILNLGRSYKQLHIRKKGQSDPKWIPELGNTMLYDSDVVSEHSFLEPCQWSMRKTNKLREALCKYSNCCPQWVSQATASINHQLRMNNPVLMDVQIQVKASIPPTSAKPSAKNQKGLSSLPFMVYKLAKREKLVAWSLVYLYPVLENALEWDIWKKKSRCYPVALRHFLSSTMTSEN